MLAHPFFLEQAFRTPSPSQSISTGPSSSSDGGYVGSNPASSSSPPRSTVLRAGAEHPWVRSHPKTLHRPRPALPSRPGDGLGAGGTSGPFSPSPAALGATESQEATRPLHLRAGRTVSPLLLHTWRGTRPDASAWGCSVAEVQAGEETPASPLRQGSLTAPARLRAKTPRRTARSAGRSGSNPPRRSGTPRG